MSKGTRVRAARNRDDLTAHRAHVRQTYQDQQSRPVTGFMSGLLKFGENRHARRKAAAQARRQQH